MSLLAPLFLLGGLAVAVPLWLHRLQTQSSNRQPFSSAMLLETTEEQVHVQKQLKYFLLLAFRIALILLVAAAFAQPYIDRPADTVADENAGTTLVVIDTSASMGRSGVFDRARIHLAAPLYLTFVRNHVRMVACEEDHAPVRRPVQVDAQAIGDHVLVDSR